MKPVSILEGTEFPKSEISLIDQVKAYFDSLGNSVKREGFGDVLLDKRGIRDSLGHKMNREKSIAFAAVPDVIRDGLEIDKNANWKGRGQNTRVFAAPVEMGEERANVAVVVKRNPTNNRYYVHSVLDENGNLFKLSNKDTDQALRPRSALGAETRGTQSVSSDVILPQEAEIVKQDDPRNIDLPIPESSGAAQQVSKRKEPTTRAGEQAKNEFTNAGDKNRIGAGFSDKLPGTPFKITDSAIANARLPGSALFGENGGKELLEYSRQVLRMARDEPLGTECAITVAADGLSYLGAYYGPPGGFRVPIPAPGVPYIMVHNHPSGEFFSVADISGFILNDDMRVMVDMGNNGNGFIMEKLEGYDESGMQRLFEALQAEYGQDELSIVRVIMRKVGDYGVSFKG
jgi:hypothetical protein